MAFAVTARQSGNSGTSAVQSLATDSTTPTADSLLLVGHGASYDDEEDAGAPPEPSGGGLTYTEINSVLSTGYDGGPDFPTRGDMSSAPVGSSPNAFQVTVSVQAGGDPASQGAVCADVIGHDAADPVAQSATNHDNFPESNDASGTVSLSATPAVGNLVVALFAVGTDNGGGFAAPTIGGQLMTTLHNQDDAFCQAGMWYRVIDGTESDNVITCPDLGQAVGNFTAVAVEIAAEAAGGVVDLDGTADTAADTQGALARTRALSGDTDTAGDGASTMVVARPLAAATDAAADAQGAAAVSRSIAATADTASGATGSLTVRRGLASSGDTAADTTAALAVTRPLTGHGDAASDADGELATSGQVIYIGSADTAADATGTLTVRRPLTATSDAAADSTADLTVSAEAVVTLIGTADAASDAVGMLTMRRALSGTADAASDMLGDLAETVPPEPAILPPYREPSIPAYAESGVAAYRETKIPAYREPPS